jgi:hypothetical protein
MADYTGIDNDDIRQVQDYMRREFDTLMRPLKHPVYHYTTGEAAASILEEAKLRATNILYLDDGREMQHSVVYFRQAMAMRQDAGHGSVGEALNEMIARYLSEVGDYVPPDIWIATFTAQYDCPRQWRRVSEESHGVALGFPAAGIVRAAEAGGALLAPCCYDERSKIEIMSRGLDLLEKLYAKRLKGGAKMPQADALVRYVVRELALFGALMKPSEYADENEWRMVLCNPSQTAVGARRITALARPEYTSLYIDLEIADATDRLPISEILIGPSQRQQMTTRAFRTLLYKHGYERADVVPSQVALSN